MQTMTKTLKNVEETRPTPSNNKNHHTEENKYIQPKFFNLSEATLSKYQTCIPLGHLKSTPSTKINSIQLTCDFKTFKQNFRLTEYFGDLKVTSIDQKLVSSNWQVTVLSSKK